MDRKHVKELLKKYGYNTISFQSMMGDLSYFSLEGIEGCISYVKIKKTYLAIGDPLVSDVHFYELVHNFRNFCKGQKYLCVFISITKVCQKKLDIMDFGYTKIGEESFFDFRTYDYEGTLMKSNRNFLKRAQKEGVRIERISHFTNVIQSSIEQVNNHWAKTKKIGSLGFLLHLDPGSCFKDKYIFAAFVETRLVAYLVCVPIYQRNGFYFEDLIRSKDAPIGTNQYIIHEAIQHLKQEGYSMASFGNSPLANTLHEDSIEHKKIVGLFDFLYKNVKGFYNFKGLHAFKKSLYPSSWESKYIAFYPKKMTLKIFLAIIYAYYPKGISGMLLSRVRKILLQRR